MQARLAPEWAAARGPTHDESVNGRNVGAAPALPIVREGVYQLPPDNGGVPPAQPREQK